MFDRARKKTPGDLRSARWFAPDDLRSFGHRSRILQMGYAPADYMGKPIIGILNTWSDLNPCHVHFKARVEDVKRGVLEAGGFPAEMPAITLSESFMKPTTMLYRNLLAMEAEEQIRAHPVDGVVLMGGCDKTTPGLIMGALSAGMPMIFLPAGPMLRGNYAGQALGSGSDAWKYWDERRAGNITDKQWLGVEGGIARSYGHCMTMGTASTMTAIADSMGLTLPGASSIPAPDANHIRMSVGMRPADRRDGLGGSDARPDRDAGLGPQRRDRGDGHGLLDQRCRAPARDGPPRPGAADARRPRRARAHHAAGGQRPAVGQGLPDGGLLLRRRPARADEHHPRQARPDRADRHRPAARRRAGGRRGLQRRRHPAVVEPGLPRGLAGGAEGQPRPERRGDQAGGLRPEVPRARRPGDGLRQLPGDEGGDRRRDPRRDPGPCAGAAQRRPARRAGHAGMGHAAACRRRW